MATKRTFAANTLIHCYQNTVNGYLLFYSVSDFLVYFTHFCVSATRHKITVAALCIMIDHIHSGVKASEPGKLSAFIREVSSEYSYSDTCTCHRSGNLFNRPFGSAPKIGDKKVRTNIIYIGNNPVERKLCFKAVEYRWNFLAYACSDHPFSEKLVIRKASWHMKKAVKEVRAEHKRQTALSYNQLQRLFKPLSNKEKLQLVDHIISLYNVIDYEYSASFFGGYDQMLKAMEYNTGSEYDISENFVGRSDECYSKISAWLIKNLKLKDVHEVFLKSEQEREELMWTIYHNTGINKRQLAKYLRLNIVFR